jgi:hypothetical protein
MTIPNPIGADPRTIAEWLKTIPFPYDSEEMELVSKTIDKIYTDEPMCIGDQYALRILYWQVVGWLRKT